MTWLQRYRLRHFFSNSIWILPVLSMILAFAVVRILQGVSDSMQWQSPFHPDSVRAVLGSLAGATFTFVVFVCSSLLLVVQLASAQLTPRIIGVLFKDPITKLTLSTFVFTFVLSIATLLRIGDSVPLLTVEITCFGSATCVGLFLFLIDRVSKMLRPSGALSSLAWQAHQAIEMVYPRRLAELKESKEFHVDALDEQPFQIVPNAQQGVVLAFDTKGLVELGRRHNAVIELAPQVGNFIARNEPLFRIYGKATVPEEILRDSIAIGNERTIEQDPAFAFRVVVDIASKGLSPAINDPTTAVLAIDQIHHLLRKLGKRSLEDEQVRDSAGKVRLMYRTPDWQDFVTLAVTEIRHFGGNSIQVARRLRAMIEDLIQTLTPERAAPLRQELATLKRTAERFFIEPEDRALADVSDAQGVGGKRQQDRGSKILARPAASSAQDPAATH